MKLETLRELLIHECQDLYGAEEQIIEALPKMIEKAQAPELKNALKAHLEETRAQVMRLDQVCDKLDLDKKRIKCKGIEGLIKEGGEMLKQDAEPEVRDAGIIAAAQKVEHYEIASYGCARTYAQLLQNRQAVDLLEQTLQEEKDADEKLTELAQQINVEAQTSEEPMEAEEAPKRRAKAAS